MRTGFKFAVLLLSGTLCLGSALGDSTHRQKKSKKPELPPLPSGPTGPIQHQIPLDAIPAVPPQVTYKDGQLTIVAPNSTLGDILRAVRKQTGAEIEIPEAKERVVTRLGPGPARDVMADLLNGSRFNYVLLGSAEDANLLTRVVLVPRTPDTAAGGATQPSENQAGNAPGAVLNVAQPVQDANMAADATDDSADDSADDADQNAADAEQQTPAAPEQQPGVKTPQQILQEMQQRQLLIQQQQQQQGTPPGVYPQPGMPVPPRPPQQDQQ
jgi:hypothetical protein